MDKLELQTMRAAQAQQVLSNELFDQAFNDTRAGIMELWASMPTSDSENAKDLHRMIKCLDRVKRCLQVHIETGKLATREIEGRSKRPFSFGAR